MKKIFFVMEDYNEMVFVETILKKIGFDCTGVQNDNNLADKILSFSPHLIIGDGMGRKINGIGLSQKIKKQKGHPKTILVFSPPNGIDEGMRKKLSVDGTLNRPIHPSQLVETIASVLEIPAEPLVAKMVKLGLFQEMKKEDLTIVKSKPQTRESLLHLKGTSLSESERLKKYDKHLSELPAPKVDGLARSKVVEQVKEFRSRENDPEIHQIDAEREAFTKALFKK